MAQERGGKRFKPVTPEVAMNADGHSSYLWRSRILCNKQGARGPSWRGNVLLSAHPYRRGALHGYAIGATVLRISAASSRLLRAGRAPAAQVPPVKPGRGQFGDLVEEERGVDGLRAGLLIEREEASSLHFCCACVRSGGDVRSEFTPLFFPRLHHPEACRLLTNSRERGAERRRPRGRQTCRPNH